MKKLILILGVLFLTSCVIKTHYIQEDSQAFEKTDYNDIKVYSGMDIGNEYIVIGSVAVEAPGNGDKALIALKQEAALLGADAIIKLKLTKINSIASSTGASGVAVKIK